MFLVDLWFIDKHMDTSMKEIGKRLEQIRNALNLTQDEMGIKLEKGKSAISKYENGDAAPTFATLYKYVELGGMSFDWIFTGESKNQAPMTHVGEDLVHYNNTVRLPVRAMAGAGNPCCIDQMEPIGHITIDKSYNGPNIQVIKIRGASMEPTIMDGGYVGVDINSKEIVSGQMYAVYIPHEGVVVKRIWIGPELVKIASDNPAAPDHEIMTERINWDSFIQGRVKWVLQAYYGE